MSNFLRHLSRMLPERRQYTLENLAQHLHQADHHKKLATLFDDDEWMKARVEGSGYIYDGYLEDLSLALEYAEVETKREIVANEEPLTFASCVRYVFIRISVNSIAEH